MGDQRNGGIAWCDTSWNPLRGCSRVSEGCRNCYAERQAARYGQHIGQPYHGLSSFENGQPRWTGEVRLVESALTDPLRWREPRRVFVNSMSDLFHKRVPDGWIDRVFAVMARAPKHTFQILTKRPERMRAYCDGLTSAEGARRLAVAIAREFAGDHDGRTQDVMDSLLRRGGDRLPLPNVWLGTSVENQPTADERIAHLLATPAAVRFVSYEPALGPVDFARCLPGPGPGEKASALQRWTNGSGSTGLDWIIVGGESGPGARPFDVEWARSTIAACKAAGVACFVKQLGARPHDGEEPDHNPNGADKPRWWRLRDRKGGDPSEWPEDLRVREFPSGGAK